MKNLIILTNSFPYEGGEQFIESEVHYWANTTFDNIYIIPKASTSSDIRFYPENLTLHPRIKASLFEKLICIIMVLINIIFWRELSYIFKSKNIKLKNILIAFKTVIQVKLIEKQLSKTLNVIEGDIIVYSYWNDVDFYAACELKKTGKILKIFSRAHGYDCYEERRLNLYMPLKRQYSTIVDKIFLLSDSAKNYYKNIYNYPDDKLDISRLGVFLPSNEELKYSYRKKIIRILSISNCVPVKRIDKILMALNLLSSQEQLEVQWTHIGGGELLESLKKKAQDINIGQSNILFMYEFKGSLSNSAVKKILLNNKFDLFINTSESEGVPVSIMEAMSHSIPVIAPNVGGIADIVNSKTGKLLTANPSIEEIVNAIKEVFYSSMYLCYRKNAFLMVKNKFNADYNYKKFIEKIEKIVFK